MRMKLKVAGSIAIGRSHKLGNIVCQDRVFTSRINKNTGIIVLADGAGSASHSHIGAEYAVSGIYDLLKEHDPFKIMLNKNYAKKIINFLINGLEKITDEQEISLKQLASTLLFVILKVRKDKVRYFAGHIGDGLILVNNKGETSILSHPDQGEYASTTYFLTSKNAETRLRLYSGELQSNSSFLLMSDGASDCLYRKKDRFLAPACQQIFKWGKKYKKPKVQSLIEKNLVSVFTQQTQDDCSMALMTVTGL